jgi:hypothetical protein
MEKIKDYIEDYITNIWLFCVSIIFEIATCVYIFVFKNSQAVKSITTNENLNTVTKAFKIVQLPDYYQHLIVGLIWIFVLLGIILYTLKQKKYLGTLIYIIFIVAFWLFFWDPILTSFLILGALGIAGIYSFDN